MLFVIDAVNPFCLTWIGDKTILSDNNIKISNFGQKESTGNIIRN